MTSVNGSGAISGGVQYFNTATATFNGITPTAGTGLTVTTNNSTLQYALSSPVSVSNGGTGATTLTGILTGNGVGAVTASTVTQNGVLYGGPSNAVSSTSLGTANTVLLGTGAAPSFGQVPNAALVNSSITITAGTNISVSAPSVSLGDSITIAASSTVLAPAYRDVSGTVTVTTADYFLSVDTSGGTATLNLPNPSTNQIFVIKDRTGDANTNSITITPPMGMTIDGSASSYVITVPFASIQLLYNNSNFEIW